MILRRVLCCGSLLALTSCSTLPLPGRARTANDAVGWKVVWQKLEPNLVVAIDRTECEVGRDRFEKIEEGRRIFCHWRSRS